MNRFEASGVSDFRLEQMINAESNVPAEVFEDTTLRAKVNDPCGMTCDFCHNEGTPVAFLGSTGTQSLRVSVFEETNGVDFMPGEMRPDQQFLEAVYAVRESTGSTALHWTGGEPTLSKSLPGLTEAGTQAGFIVRMTSNGEKGSAGLDELADAGLTSITYSIFGTTGEELSATQAAARKLDIAWGNRKVERVYEAIGATVGFGMNANANIVVGSPDDGERVSRIIDNTDLEVTLQLQADLSNQVDGWRGIYSVLDELDAEPVGARIVAGTADAKVDYVTPDGRRIVYKRFVESRLPDTCGGCELNNPTDCKEGFYGVRLYVDDENAYRVGICLQRMDLTVPVNEFIESGIPEEVRGLRAEHMAQLEGVSGSLLADRMRATLLP